jgi:hypothetical protein
MPVPEGELTTSEIWNPPVEEVEDDLQAVPESSGDEPAEQDQGSEA